MLLALLCTLLLNTNASAQEKVPVIFQLSGPIEAHEAPYFYGIKKGYYAKEGIDLSVKEGGGSMATAEKVASGGVRIAAADASVLVAFDGKVKMIASILPASLHSIVYRADRGIRSVKDLKGKKIAVNPAGAAARLLPTVLRANGLKPDDVVLVPTAVVKDRLEKLAKGEVDAVTWSLTSHKYAEAMTGMKLELFTFAANGAATAGEGIIVGSKMSESTTDRDLLCKFLRATRRAWVDAGKDVKGTVDIFHEMVPGIHAGDKSVSRWGWEKTIEITRQQAVRKKPFGYIFEDDWSKLLELLKEPAKKAETSKPVSIYVTNQFNDCMNQGS